MTLFKQIAILVTMGFILLLGLVCLDNLNQATTLLRGQMKTTAQDTATVLAISISTTKSNEDGAALETLFNAVFDSGYYSQIRMTSPDGVVIEEKQRSLSVKNVPDWFVDTVRLETAVGRADVMRGWMPVGSIEISLHPGYAYAVLYQRMVSTLLWFFCVSLLVLALLWFALHRILKPLHSIALQAEGIQKNNFTLQTEMPRTKELKEVVSAMNRLTRSVKSNFEDQQAIWSRYQSLLYYDDLTGLRNRRFLLSELHRLVSDKTSYQGAMALIKIQGYSEFCQRDGFECAEEILRKTARILDQFGSDEAGQVSARLSEDEFAVLINRDRSSVESLVQTLFSEFKLNVAGGLADVSLSAGVAEVTGGGAITSLLASLDLSVNQALASGPYQLGSVAGENYDLPEGKEAWRVWFHDALDNHRFYLVGQCVFDRTNLTLHREVFVRVDDGAGKAIPAGIFMPMAKSLGCDAEIYRAILQMLPAALASCREPLALNFPGLYLENELMYREFLDLLESCNKYRLRLVIEVEHSQLIAHPESVKELVDKVRAQGQGFGIDHLDLSGSVDLLRTINPDYVKIGAKVLEDYGANPEKEGYSAFRGITHTLDMRLIAVGVDDVKLYNELKSMGVDGFQGNILAPPEKIL